MTTKFQLLDIGPCLDGELDPIQLVNDFGHHVDKGLWPKIIHNLSTLNQDQLNFVPIHITTEFQSLDLGPCVNGEFDPI
jgi:hypothetical protein